MPKLLSNVDRLLRGELALPAGTDAPGALARSTNTLLVSALVMGAIYGVSMGLYAVLGGSAQGFLQLISTMAKVPLLFIFTLAVTLPSLYVFSALAGSRLDFPATFRLLVAAVAVNLSVLASFAPITAFFTLSTDSYAFMKLLNVVFFGIAGLIGLRFLARKMSEAFTHGHDPATSNTELKTVDQSGSELPDASFSVAGGALNARGVFRVWLLIYGIVGAQMGWILRPFVGDPGAPFELFRDRRSNFFIELMKTLLELLGVF